MKNKNKNLIIEKMVKTGSWLPLIFIYMYIWVWIYIQIQTLVQFKE